MWTWVLRISLKAALSSTFRSPWNETIMFALMLRTSLKHIARGFLAVLTSWRFVPVRARVCSSLICAWGGGSILSISTSHQHHADIVDVGACTCWLIHRQKTVRLGAGSSDLWFQVWGKASVTGLPSSSPTAPSRVVKFAKGTFNHQLWHDLSSHLFVIST